MADQPAARVGDPVGHDWGMAGMIGGALLGAAVGGALIAATVVTGGAAAVAVAGLVAGGALAGGQLARGLQTVMGAQNPTTGVLSRGSPNVLVNGRAAVRAGVDAVASCSGLFSTHHLPKPSARVAEGSALVEINGRPAARVADRLECAATVTEGSPDVWIGGGTRAVLAVHDNQATWTQVAAVVGLVALGGGAVVAAAAGAVALAGYVAVGAAFAGLNEGLGWVGDRMGPGWRDVLQGGAGVAGIVAGAPRGARALQREGVAARVRANVAESRAARAASGFGQRGPMTARPGPVAARPGLETRGYRPAPGERSTTRARWKAAQSEARAQATAARLEAADGGHSLARHGSGVSDAALEARVRTGVAPDGKVSPTPNSTRFNSGRDWVSTRQTALKQIEQTEGISLRNPPAPGSPTKYTVVREHGRPIDDGFIGTGSPTKVPHPTNPSAKPVKVFSNTSQVDGLTRTRTSVAWDPASNRWKVVQHFPEADHWSQPLGTYQQPVPPIK